MAHAGIIRHASPNRRTHQLPRRPREDREVDSDSEAILREVRRIMAAKHLSVADLARLADVHLITMYQRLSPGRYGYGPLKVTTIRSFATALGVPLRTLLRVLPDRLT